MRVPSLRPTLPLKRTLRFVWQRAPGWTLASLILLVVQGILPLLALYLIKLVVDTLAQAGTAADKPAVFRHALVLIGLSGGVALLTSLCDAIAGLVSELQSQVVTDSIQDIVHAKAIEADLEYYENCEYYNALHRAQQDASFRPTRIVRSLAQLGQSGISLIGIAGLLCSLHWAIALLLFVAAVPGVLVRVKFARITYDWQRRRTLLDRQSQYLTAVLTYPIYAKEVRQFGFGPLFRHQFSRLRQQLRRERFQIGLQRSTRDAATQVIAVLAVFGTYAFVAYQTVLGALTVGGLVMYYGAVQRGLGYLQSFMSGFAGLYEDNLFLSNLYEFLDLQRKVAEPPEPTPVPAAMQTGIVFDHVGFRYSGSDRAALEDVSFTIRPGEVVALVGENGSGKTTLVKLLCRLYDVTSGAITVDGIDLRGFSPNALRRQISVVFQDYVKYHLTARENIWLGDPQLSPEDEKVTAAARLAGADKVIATLKHGYDTHLGKWFDDGEEISIGEWQKIALARAFVSEAPIIILDEPTSALDARAEQEVFERFRQLIRGKTAILISHRLSSVRKVDRIFVLAEGRLIESGTHDELIQRGGTYAGLFETQARHYQ